MSKEQSDENGKGGIVEALKGVKAAIEMFGAVPKEVLDALKETPNLVRPNYEDAAKGFEEISKKLRESFDRLIKFVQRVVDLRSEDVNLKRLQTFVKEYRSANVEQIARDIKFKCGEIDTIYNQKTRQWFKSFLGLRNKFADNIVKTKGKAADELMMELTRIDGNLVEDLIKNIITPLRDYAIEIVDAGDIREQKRIHKKMQASFRKTLRELEDSLRVLDDAVVKFRKLASKKS
jgi:hypothetical protein